MTQPELRSADHRGDDRPSVVNGAVVHGLPPDWHPQYIPTLTALQNAAGAAIDRATVTVLLLRDAPALLCERLDDIAGVIHAALPVDGPHQARAIRLGLELDAVLWMRSGKLETWCDLILAMLATASRLGDRALLGRVYRAWATYLYLTEQRPGARRALQAALEYARISGDEGLILLLLAERLYLAIGRVSIETLQARGLAIVHLACHRREYFTAARALLVLARACRIALLPEPSFAYAQQALVLLHVLGLRDLIDQALHFMLFALQIEGVPSSAGYRAALLQRLDALQAQEGYPWLREMTAFQHALYAYHAGQYDEARRWALLAYAACRAKGLERDCVRIRHLLGVIAGQRGRYAVAEHHLQAVWAYTEAHQYREWMARVQIGRASVRISAGDYAGAWAELERARELAGTLPAGQVRDVRLRWVERWSEQLRALQSSAIACSRR